MKTFKSTLGFLAAILLVCGCLCAVSCPILSVVLVEVDRIGGMG